MKKSSKIWLFLSISIGIVFGYTIKSTVSSINKSDAILKVLKENCDCKEVNQIIYAKGIQYHEKDGVTTEKAEYELIDCSYNSVTEEGERINTLLNSTVEKFNTIDFIELEFTNANSSESVVIKNGKVQP